MAKWADFVSAFQGSEFYSSHIYNSIIKTASLVDYNIEEITWIRM